MKLSNYNNKTTGTQILLRTRCAAAAAKSKKSRDRIFFVVLRTTTLHAF